MAEFQIGDRVKTLQPRMFSRTFHNKTGTVNGISQDAGVVRVRLDSGPTLTLMAEDVMRIQTTDFEVKENTWDS